MTDKPKSNVIPFAEHAITSADLGDQSAIETRSAADLIDVVEAQGFEGEAGPLENSMEWIEIKRRLVDPMG